MFGFFSPFHLLVDLDLSFSLKLLYETVKLKIICKNSLRGWGIQMTHGNLRVVLSLSERAVGLSRVLKKQDSTKKATGHGGLGTVTDSVSS